MFRILFAVTLVISLTGLSLSVVHAEDSPKAVGTFPADEGVIVSFLDVPGYTYMELANGGEKFWIAAPTTEVKNGEHIRFVESMAMHNYTSKTLNRTFNRLIFVSSTQVEVKQKK